MLIAYQIDPRNADWVEILGGRDMGSNGQALEPWLRDVVNERLELQGSIWLYEMMNLLDAMQRSKRAP